VRELKNLVQRAYIMAEEEIGAEHLPAEAVESALKTWDNTAAAGDNGTAELGSTLTVRVGSSVAEVEHRLILATLGACGGNKQKAADVLGVSLKTLYNRLTAYKETEKRDQ
jgi:DNA-binding NtrC family response regulator